MARAMPEATVLYSVTAVVVAGLVIWVAAVLVRAKEPWARPMPLLAMPDAPGVVTTDADDTAPATPVALGEAKAAAEPAAKDEQ